MRLKNILTIALLATAGIGLTHPTAQAAAVTYNNGDLLLGFRASSGSGAQLNYVVNLGQASTFRDATNSFVIPLTGLNTDLSAIFLGDDWKTRGDVFWSVSGTTGSFVPVAGDPAKTLYATRAQAFSNGNFTPASAWLSKSDAAQGLGANQLKSFKDGFLAKAGVPNQSTANTPNGIIQNTSDNNSYASFTSSGSSFGFFNPSVEANFGNGQNASRLDLFSVKPADGVNVMLDEPGELLGTFVLYPSGNIAFIAPGDVLPPDIEAVKPVVNLAATPKAGTKFNAPASAQTFSGTLTEVNLDTFTYSVNGGAPVDVTPDLTPALPSAGPFTWSTSISLVPGVNSIAFSATDLSGNTTTVSRAVSYLQPIPSDTLTPNDGTIVLPKGVINAGFAYTFTAKPPAGQIVSQWFNNNAPIVGQAGAKLTITPQDGDLYTATFVPNFFPAVVGTYPGIFGDGDTALPTTLTSFNLENGSATFKIAATGAFSGTVTVGGKALKVKGQFDGQKNATVVTAALSLDLDLDTTTAGFEKITGTAIYNGGTPLNLESFRATSYTGKGLSVSPLNGKRYSLALQRPAADTTLGHGFASVAIGKTGVATVSGQLPDGTAFTTAVPVVEKGSDKFRLPVSRQLAKGNTGLLHGELEIDNVTNEIESTANFGWLRASVTKPTLPFASGILKSLSALGSRWILPPNTNLLTGTGQIALFSLGIDKDNVFVALNAANAAALYYGYWPSTNKPGINALPKGTTFAFAPATGAFSGKTLRLSATNKAVSLVYRGLVLPEQVLIAPAPALSGVGYSTTGSLSGKVELGEQIVTP